MELAENGSLRSVITKNRNKLVEDQKAKIIGEVLIGIQAMHKKFICHRDLKPENILLN